MQHTIQSVAGREILPSINPALAGFDRALRSTRPPGGSAEIADERAVLLGRARAVVARTRLLWG
jgi:hypothetical protein